jgi:Tfp pilus assembly protein PilN
MIEFNLLKPKNGSSLNARIGPAILIGFATSILVLATLISWYLALQSEMERELNLESSLRKQSRELDQIEALLTQYQNSSIELEGITKQLERLDKNRKIPLKTLDLISESVAERNKLSLIHLSQSKQRVHLTGNSFDFKSIKDLVLSLRTSSLFESVEVKRLEMDKGQHQFEIFCLAKD